MPNDKRFALGLWIAALCAPGCVSPQDHGEHDRSALTPGECASLCEALADCGHPSAGECTASCSQNASVALDTECDEVWNDAVRCTETRACGGGESCDARWGAFDGCLFEAQGSTEGTTTPYLGNWSSDDGGA